MKRKKVMEYKTYEEIKEIVGDGWAFIANPKRKNNSVELEGGELIYHDADKQKVIQASLNLRKGLKEKKVNVVTIHYCGERPDLIVLL